MKSPAYSQFFEASAIVNGTKRRGALVFLQSDSEAGHIQYTANVTFIPYETKDDFRVAYDGLLTKILYEGKGRRSKKRESEFLKNLHKVIDELCKTTDSHIFWDKALNEARFA